MSPQLALFILAQLGLLGGGVALDRYMRGDKPAEGKTPPRDKYHGWALDQEQQGFIPEVPFAPYDMLGWSKMQERRQFDKNANAAERSTLRFYPKYIPDNTVRPDQFMDWGDGRGGMGPNWGPGTPQIDREGRPWS